MHIFSESYVSFEDSAISFEMFLEYHIVESMD